MTEEEVQANAHIPTAVAIGFADEPFDSATQQYGEPFEGQLPAADEQPPASSKRLGKRKAATSLAAASAAAVEASQQDVRTLEVCRPREMLNRNSFGMILLSYRSSHSMLHPAAFLSETQRDQEDERAAGHEQRMQAMLDELRTRKLLLSVCTPDAYNHALYLNSMAQQSRQQQINYVFADSLRIVRHPSTGETMITHDPEVAAALVAAGYVEQPFSQVKSTLEMQKLLLEKEQDQVMAAAAQDAARRIAAAGTSPAQMPDQQEAAEAMASLLAQPEIPTTLASDFRVQVMGDGNVGRFGSSLKAAVESKVVWQGKDYSPLMMWSVAACKGAWAAAGDAELVKWEQTVMEMLQAYCLLRRLENREAVCDAPELADFVCKIRDGTASFTVIRKACKTLTKVRGAPEGNYRVQTHALLPQEPPMSHGRL